MSRTDLGSIDESDLESSEGLSWDINVGGLNLSTATRKLYFSDSISQTGEFEIDVVFSLQNISGGEKLKISKENQGAFYGVVTRPGKSSQGESTLAGGGAADLLRGVPVSGEFLGYDSVDLVNEVFTQAGVSGIQVGVNEELTSDPGTVDARADDEGALKFLNRVVQAHGGEWYTSYNSQSGVFEFNVTSRLESSSSVKSFTERNTERIEDQPVVDEEYDGVVVKGYGDGDDQVTGEYPARSNWPAEPKILKFTDKTILSKKEADNTAENIYNKHTEWRSIYVYPSNRQELLNLGDKVDVTEPRTGVDGTFRVVSRRLNLDFREGKDIEYVLSDKPLGIVDEAEDVKSQTDSQTDYMQGSRNVWSDKTSSNASSQDPLILDFEVPEDVLDKTGENRLKRIEFNYACQPYKVTGGSTSVTASNFDPNVKNVSTEVDTAGVKMEKALIEQHGHATGSSSSSGASEVQASDGFLFDQAVSASGWTRLTDGSGNSLASVTDVDGDLEHALNFEIDTLENIYLIVGVDTTNEIFTVEDNATQDLSQGDEFEVNNSTGNDGTYTVSSTNYNSSNNETSITVNEDVTDSTADGSVFVELTRDLQFALLGSDDTPTASFNYNPSLPDTSDNVEFVSSSGPGRIASYHWRIRDVTNSEFEASYVGNDFGHSFDEAADYDVTLEIYKNGGLGGDLLESDASNDVFIFEGDITADLESGDKVVITDSDGNDGRYTVDSFTTNANSNTEITVFEDVKYSFTDSSAGQIEYFPGGGSALTDSTTQTVTVSSSINSLSAEEKEKLEAASRDASEEEIEKAARKISSSNKEIDINEIGGENISTQNSLSIIDITRNPDTFWVNSFSDDLVVSNDQALVEVINSSNNNGVYKIGPITSRNSGTEYGLELREGSIPSTTADGDALLDDLDQSDPSYPVLLNSDRSIAFEGFLLPENGHAGDVEVYHTTSPASSIQDTVGTQSFNNPGGFESFSLSKNFNQGELSDMLDGPKRYKWFGNYLRPIGDRWVNKSDNGVFTDPTTVFNVYELHITTESSSQTIGSQSFDFEWSVVPRIPLASWINSVEVVHTDPDGNTTRTSVFSDFEIEDGDAERIGIPEGDTGAVSSPTTNTTYSVTVNSTSDTSAEIDIDGSIYNVSEGEFVAHDGIYFHIDRIDDLGLERVYITTTPHNDSDDPFSQTFNNLSQGDHEFYVEADVDDSGGTTLIQSGTATITVSLNDPPVADFSFSPTNPDTFEPVDFNDQSSDPDGNEEIIEWRWDFGDGTTETITSSSTNVGRGDTSHSYDTGDTYTVTLTVEDSSGATDTHTDSVTVGQVDSLDETVVMDSEENVGGSPETIGASALESSGDTALMGSSNNVGALSAPGSNNNRLMHIRDDIPSRDTSADYEMYLAFQGSEGADEVRGDFEIINRNHFHDIPRQDDFEGTDAKIGAGAEEKEINYARANEDQGNVLLDFSTNNETITLDTTLNSNSVTVTVGNIDQDGNISNTEQLQADSTSTATTDTTTNTYQDEELYVKIDSASDKQEFELYDQSQDDVYTLAAAPQERFRSASTSQDVEGVSSDDGTEQDVVEDVTDELLQGSTANNVRVFIDTDPDDDSTNTEQEITDDFYSNDTDGDGNIDSGTPKDKELDISQYVDNPGWYRLKIVPDQATFAKSRVFLDHHKDSE